jgi:hypothetical protein
LTLFVLLLLAEPALGYVGPGAGLEFVDYFFVGAALIAVLVAAVLAYPLYVLIRHIRGRKDRPSAEVAAESANQASPEASGAATPNNP